MSKRTLSSLDTDRTCYDDIMREIHNQSKEVDRIRKERLKVQELKEEFSRKQFEMQRLLNENKQLHKYKAYYQKYTEMKHLLDDTISRLNQKQRDNNDLLIELEKALQQIQAQQHKVSECDKNRMALIKERSHLEKLNKEIEETFVAYKRECKNRERELTTKVDKLKTALNEEKKNSDLALRHKAEAAEYQAKLQESEIKQKQWEQNNVHLTQMIKLREHEIQMCKSELTKLQQNPQMMRVKDITSNNFELMQENEHLKQCLAERERELQRSKALNLELSVEFDRAVVKIGQFERELSEYRRENHEIKRKLTYYMEKEDYSKINYIKEESDSEEPERLPSNRYTINQ